MVHANREKVHLHWVSGYRSSRFGLQMACIGETVSIGRYCPNTNINMYLLLVAPMVVIHMYTCMHTHYLFPPPQKKVGQLYLGHLDQME